MGSSNTTVQKADPWEPAQPYILEGLNAASDMWKSDPNQFVIRPWEGQYTADMDKAQFGAQRRISELGSSQSQFLENNQNQFAQTRDQIASDPYNPTFQRAVDSATIDPMGNGMRERITQNVAEGVMPNINSTFGNSGMTGSSLHSAAAAKGMASALAPIELEAANLAQERALRAGSMAQGAMEANRSQALQAQGMAPALAMSTFAPLQEKERVGAERTKRAQIELAGDMQAFTQNQAGPIDAINNYLALTSGLGGQFGTSSSTATSNPGLLGMLGFGLQGAGLLGGLGLLSDERTKENIEHVGKTKGGHKVYTYNYKGDPTQHMGVMAQEAEKKTPEAVNTGPDGLKRVDYAKIH